MQGISVQLHISFRNTLQFVSKIPSFDFKTTCYSFLKYHIFILEALQTYFRNTTYLFWKHHIFILEISQIYFRNTAELF